MELDVVLLSRLQFAFTIMFHYIFPPISIGLGVILVAMEGMFLKTRDPMWEALTRFWTRIFAVNFAVGVATGIVMEFEFRSNWSAYSRFVGDVFGSALAAEGIFAFFLESGFLAVLVFGWDRVGPKMHFFSTCMVSLGSIFSAVWIIIANSWQQTPAGYHIVESGTILRDGVEEVVYRAEITDFWEMVFNPSSMERLTHTLLGAFIMGGFFVMSVAAWYLLRRRFIPAAQRMFKVGLVLATVCSLAILASGHSQAKNVAKTQPPKMAAFEGLYHTPEEGAALTLFGLPNSKEERIDFEIAIPGLLSWLIHEDFSVPVPGLDQVPEEDRPPVLIPFICYRIMVGTGFFFIGITLLACFLWWRGTLFDQRWLLWVFVFAVLLAIAANQAGWVAAEVGRQPWIVWGELRTPDGISPSVSGEEVLASIIMFGIIYALLFAVWVYVLNEKIQHGPELPAGPREGEGRTRASGWLDKEAHEPPRGENIEATDESDSPSNSSDKGGA